MIINKRTRTQQFNVRFKALLKKLIIKYNQDIGFVNKLKLLSDKMKYKSDRTIIYLFSDYLLNNNTILQHINKIPTKENIEFFSSMNAVDISQKLKYNIIFDEIKNIFTVADTDSKKEVLVELYKLKCITVDFNKVGE